MTDQRHGMPGVNVEDLSFPFDVHEAVAQRSPRDNNDDQVNLPVFVNPALHGIEAQVHTIWVPLQRKYSAVQTTKEIPTTPEQKET